MDECSGVMGLNIDSYYNILHEEGIIYNLYANKEIQSPIFALYLQKNNDGPKIDIGELDSKLLYNKTTYWVDSLTTAHWCINIGKIGFNSKEDVIFNNVKAIIDTSVGYTILPIGSSLIFRSI
jgi:Eukaryotic aspartyl protease